MHADAPEEFFGADDADVGGEAFGAPGDWGVAAEAAGGRSVFLRQVFGVFVGGGGFFKVRPGVGDRPVVAGFGGLGDGLSDFAGDSRGSSGA